MYPDLVDLASLASPVFEPLGFVHTGTIGLAAKLEELQAYGMKLRDHIRLHEISKPDRSNAIAAWNQRVNSVLADIAPHLLAAFHTSSAAVREGIQAGYQAQQIVIVNGQFVATTRQAVLGTVRGAGRGGLGDGFSRSRPDYRRGDDASTRSAATPATLSASSSGPEVAASGLARRQAATPCTTFRGRSWHRSHHAAWFTFSRLARATRLPASSFAGISAPRPK